MRNRTSAAVAAVAALFLGAGTAAAAPSGDGAGGLTVQPLPQGTGAALESLQVDTRTTWAAGMGKAKSGGHVTHQTPEAGVRAADRTSAGWLVDTPDLNGTGSALPQDLSTLGATSVMAGFTRPSVGKGFAPLAAHRRNGAWVVDTVPVPGDSQVARLNSVQVTGAHQAWAVGSYSQDGLDRAWIVRWDGTAWTTVDTSALPGGNLFGVSGTADDLWAVGGSNDDGALVFHWDGTTWTSLTLPTNPDGSLWAGWYTSVSAPASDDVWLAGPEISVHWDGTAWTNVPLPRPTQDSSLWVEKVRSSPVYGTWAAGYFTGKPRTPVALHWTGKAWETTALSANAGGQLEDIAFTAAGPVGVGSQEDPSAPIGDAGYAVRLPVRPGRPAVAVTLPPGVEHLWGATPGEHGVGLRVVGNAQTDDLSKTVPFTAWAPLVPLS